MHCHNLCTELTPPRGSTLLLGLGHNFCVCPPHTSDPSYLQKFSFDRFRQDIYTQMFFADSPNNDYDPKQLFVRSDWKPNPSDIPLEFRARVSHFLRNLAASFQRRRCPRNLSPIQTKLLRQLQTSDEFIVLPSDKNLGTVILERSIYIKRALQDHLLKESTYERLTEPQATTAMTTLRQQITAFINQHKDTDDERNGITDADFKYLKRSSDSVVDPFSHFYIIPKLHKTPWETRPIVSVCGSALHALGRWVDQQLQPICRRLPTYVASSANLLHRLHSTGISNLDKALFFKADAVSMYTNIDTTHALTTISSFLRTSELCRTLGVHAESVIAGLELIMRNNLFKFGDTFWRQRTGTAMGTPPACSYATLYYGIHELNLLPQFNSFVAFFIRYIDDILGIWIPHRNPAIDAERWKAFQASLAYGSLTWEVSPRQRSINFMDISLFIRNGKINTCLYEKERNLHLYLPAHSAHPPGVLRSLIHGMIRRIFLLTTSSDDITNALRVFFSRLCARGYSPNQLQPLFITAIEKAKKITLPSDPAFSAITSQEPTYSLLDTDDEEKRVFLHLPFHPKDPSSTQIQQLFRETLLHPPGEPLLSSLRNRNESCIGTNRLIVAYHRPRNLRNILFPRKLRTPSAMPVSSLLPQNPPNEAPPDSTAPSNTGPNHSA